MDTYQYRIALAIVLVLQGLVDGWPTELSAPIVLYDPDQFLGVRFPWDIPIEDFGFGFAMVTLSLLVWRALGPRETARREVAPAAAATRKDAP